MNHLRSESSHDLAPVDQESGYVVAQTALLLIPLMIFAAFATDIGYWYLQGQKAQRAVDAASLAAVTMLPDLPTATAEARVVAAKNGFIDATPNDNSDFHTGPLPQVEVSSPAPGQIEVKVRREEQSFLGRVVLDSIVVERFAISEFAGPLYLGNPSSGLGTGTIPESNLGVPADQTWLAINAYCLDKEGGDQLMAGYYDGNAVDGKYRQCGMGAGNIQSSAIPNPTFDPDAYVFVIEMQENSSPVDVSVFEPGSACDDAVHPVTTSDNPYGPRLYYRVFGPSTSPNHQQFVDNNAPIASGLLDDDSCYNNAPGGDGWWPIASGLPAPGSAGGYYYVIISSRSPAVSDLDSSDSYWAETSSNRFSLKATPSGVSEICIYSNANPTCPQLYGLEWLPLFRNLGGSESEFFLTEVFAQHAGSTIIVRFFDAAEGVANIQFADASDNAVPFSWRYADQSEGQMTLPVYAETDFAGYTDTCTWGGVGSNPCLDTSVRADWNDRNVEVAIDVPPDYTCGASCWWKVRYNTATSSNDRSNWSIDFVGDPVQLVE